ncbi:hypothetical protein VNO80_03325 [Phaseolus coccineus]|uniref:Uncharacterized protein n=1 Tax=Phaseolus coccineus TaxID=3886 RepID=A0AAN9NRZ7_PHACN
MEAQPNTPISLNANFFALIVPLFLFLLSPHVFECNPTLLPPPPTLHGWKLFGDCFGSSDFSRLDQAFELRAIVALQGGCRYASGLHFDDSSSSTPLRNSFQ